MLKLRFIILYMSALVGNVFGVSLGYDENSSLKANEKKLTILLQNNCKDFGLSFLDSRDSNSVHVQKLLKTYPKEILYKYLKNHKDDICYYNYSLLVKYLVKEFSSNISELYQSKISACLKGQSKNKKHCLLNQDFFFVDSANILGEICSKKSYQLTRQLNCSYSDFKKSKCLELNYADYQSCPEYQNFRIELRSFHKNFSKKCSKFKWKWPKCMKDI